MVLRLGTGVSGCRGGPRCSRLSVLCLAGIPATWLLRDLYLGVSLQASLTDSHSPNLGLLPLQRCPVSKPNMGHQHRAQDPETTWQATP